MTSSSNRFFPRDSAFWLYHCVLLTVITVINGIAIFAWGDKRIFDVASHSVWLPCFTTGVLFFRLHCRKYNWYRLNTGDLIARGLAYATLIAVGSTAISLALTLPFFWGYLFTPDFLAKYHTTVGHQLARMVVYGILSSHLFASAWIFVYMSVIISRRAGEAELEKLQLEAGLREAQIASLSNQLNPHFLFNSLNNIRFLIHESPSRADDAITGLSEILRYSLGSEKRSKVSLGEELAVVKRYIDLVSLQLEERLYFQLEASEKLHKFAIPPMTLQLLVENAVKHGIDQSVERSLLLVQVTDQEQALCIHVHNSYDCRRSAWTVGTGTGLNNIRQRLQLLYAGEASLNIEKLDKLFKVSLILPKEVP